MCRANAPKKIAEDTKPPSGYFACAKFVGIAFLLFWGLSTVLISELIGGRTRRYTSFGKFAPAESLKGKVAVVTGANTGIGYYTALELARHGAHVIATSRSQSKGDAALLKMEPDISKADGSVVFLQLDLSSLASVKTFASAFLKLGLPLNMLVLNAGVMKSPGAGFIGQTLTYGFETTKEGFEQHIGVNHIAHAYLTDLLLDKLKDSAPSRIVSVSSLAEEGSYEPGFLFDQWLPKKGRMPPDYEDGAAYGQSKLANIMYTQSLAEKLQGTGITAYSLHPGVIHTELGRHMDPVMAEGIKSKSFVERLIATLVGGWIDAIMMPTADGALNQLYVSTAPASELSNGGLYFPVGGLVEPKHPQSGNETLRALLWKETKKAISKRDKYDFKP